MLIDDILAHHERYTSREPAVISKDQVWTYGKLGEMRRRCANLLSGLGVKKGDRVAVLTENSPWFLVTLFATVRLGAIFVPLNYRLPGEDISEILRDAGVRVLFAQPKFLEPVIDAASPPEDCIFVALGTFGRGGVFDIEDIIAKSSDSMPCIDIEPDDPALLQYTSGTTGKPKGVISNHRAWIQSCLIQIPLKRIFADSVFLGLLPMCYTGGAKASLEVMFAGAALVIAERFDEDEALESIGRHHITNTFVVPTMLYRLLDAQSRRRCDVASLKYINCGGAPLSPERVRQAVDLLECSFTQGYGMTELAGGSITFAAPEDHFKDGRVSSKLSSVGRPLIDCFVKLADENGAEVEIGAPGEVLVKTSRALVGYWGKSSDAAPIDPEGFFHTGDIARQDEDGYLYIVDRKKDMIISGGLNIFSKEIETVLEAHDAVKSSYVVGVPDDQWGENVLAFIVLHDGKNCTKVEILEWSSAQLARYKVPRMVQFLREEDVPVNWGGKVLKRELRQKFLQQKFTLNQTGQA